jgi:ubiquinone/menaquinone biosynthesis C-methylase UbiE
MADPDAAFYASATEVVNRLESELRRVPQAQRGGGRALEIGCGSGRLMRPMSRHFAEIHGVDISSQRVAVAREQLRDIPHAHAHVIDRASLSQFPDDWFDFVFSSAIFQQTASREVILTYLQEIRRALKPGGLAGLQFNGSSSDRAGAWTGAPFTSHEILEFTRFHDMQVLSLEGAATPNLWTSWRKQQRGWHAAQHERTFAEQPSRIRRVQNSQSTEPGAPCRGCFASIALGVQNLPPEAGLHHLRVLVGDSLGTITQIGPARNDGLQTVTVLLPDLEATGLLPVELRWLDTPIAPPATLRVIPPGPSIPRICFVAPVETRQVKMTLEEVAHPHEIQASVGGHAAMDLEFLCLDPRPQRFEVKFHLPEEVTPGLHELQVRIGRRKFAPVMLDVSA